MSNFWKENIAIPHVVFQASSPGAGYIDITSDLVELDQYGTRAENATVNDVRSAMQTYLDSNPFPGLTSPEQLVVSKWFLVGTADRNSVHTTDEQRSNAELLATLLFERGDSSTYDYIVNTLFGSEPAAANTLVDYETSDFNTRIDQGGIGSDPVSFTNTVSFNGVVTDTATSNLNDYNPTGFSTCNNLRINATGGSTINFDGLQAGGDGQIVIIRNTGDENLRLRSNRPSSLPANRFDLDTTQTIEPREAIMVEYMGSPIEKWRLIGNR